MWWWRRLSRAPWTARRSKQSILKEINSEYSLEGLLLKLQHFGYLMQRADLLEKTLMLGKTEGKRRRWQTSVKETDPAPFSWVWQHRGGWSQNNIQRTIWWEDLLHAVPQKTAKSSSTSFTGIKPSSLAWGPGLWECRLWDRNCIKDYFGPRMSLISQVLTVVCWLEDLNFAIISHTNQEKTGFLKSTCEKMRSVDV